MIDSRDIVVQENTLTCIYCWLQPANLHMCFTFSKPGYVQNIVIVPHVLRFFPTWSDCWWLHVSSSEVAGTFQAGMEKRDQKIE